MRLALVPFGYILGMLPQGNPGRATVSAFAPMPVRPDLAQLLSQTLALIQTPDGVPR